MATQLSAANESSVVFNLRQLMQLEHERVSADEARARAVRAAQERARAERERNAREEAERAATERQAMLLRVQLQAEAVARAERERVALEHAQQLQRMQHEARRALVTRVLVAACGTLIAASLVHATLTESRPRVVAAVVREDAQAAARAAEELSELRRRLADQVAASVPGRGVSEAVAPPQVAKTLTPAVHRVLPKHRPIRAAPQPRRGGPIDSASDDPLFGI
jgi:hypothetical protein